MGDCSNGSEDGEGGQISEQQMAEETKDKWLDYLSTLLMQTPLLDTFNDSNGTPVSIQVPTSSQQKRSNGVVPLTSKNALVEDSSRRISDSNNLRMFLTSVVELLCSKVHANDADKQEKLFKVLAQVLTKTKLVSPILVADELSPLRGQYRMVLQEILDAANSIVLQSSPNTPTGSAPFTYRRRVSQQHSRETCSDCQLANWRSFFSHRYDTEFQEMCKLGKGGFGEVYKTHYTVDACYYAVKKVRFSFSDSGLAFHVLSEVRTLARLNHPNIVRYHSSWFELDADGGLSDTMSVEGESAARRRHQSFSGVSLEIREIDEESVTNAHRISGNDTRRSVGRRRRSVSNTSVVFKHADVGLSTSCTSRGSSRAVALWSRRRFAHHFNDDSNVAASSTHGDSRRGRSKFWAAASSVTSSIAVSDNNKGQLVVADDKHEQDLYRAVRNLAPTTSGFILYIQMELCADTLRGYLKRRNDSSVANPSDAKFATVDNRFNKRVLSQLLEAIDYIHSQSLVHRDIKPSNIFLRDAESGHVLLGDFGLACMSNNDDGDYPTSVATNVTADEDGCDDDERLKSSGVGTYTYSAPEQLNQGKCGPKVDMFSVGIVAYEMYFPFSTYMEKIQHLMEVRKGRLTDEFQQQWPIEAGVIRQLVNSNPLLRPSAAQLLKELYEAKTGKDQQIKALEAELSAKEHEIARLRELLSKDRSL